MLAVVLLLQVAAPQVWAAAYGGTFNSATPQTPVTLGQALGTTVAVKNTGILPWQENASAAWRTTVDSPSWAATWSSLRFDSVANVNAGANASMIVNLSAAQLPTVPGDYAVRLHTSYNQSGFYTELSGSPKTVSFTIASGNHAPVVTPVGVRTAVESNLLSFTVTATDADSPTQKLAFSLEAGAPAGASVNSSNGLFTWTPPKGYTPVPNLISVRVTDDGTPALADMRKSLGARTVAYPTPVFVVGTYDVEGQPNLMTVSWAGICCSVPPCVSISLRRATYTYGNLIHHKAFTLNIPSQAQARAADYLGMASGRDVNKFKEARLTPVQSTLVRAPYVEEFPVVLECRLAHTFELGLHTQFIGEIMDVKADEEMIGPNGRTLIEKVAPFLFDPESQRYFNIGAPLGEAFSMGLLLANEPD